jgi:ubiquinone/menaquinone biosynthesis C-methylase UbiE
MSEAERDRENPSAEGKASWNANYEREGDIFEKIQEDMPEVLELLKEKGVKNVLDLGCGTGRHSVFLGENGMNVSGMDYSVEGVKRTQEKMAEKGLAGDFRQGDMHERLPYDDASFDAIVSTQTINHGTIEQIRDLIKEMERVLTPNGIIFLTTGLGEEGSKGGRGTDKKIAPHTFVPTEGTEKGLPHYYFDEERLAQEFNAFKTRIWKEKGGRHLCMIGERIEQEGSNP